MHALLLGLLREVALDVLNAQATVPPPLKAFTIMALTVGLFGTVFLMIQRWLRKLLQQTHKTLGRRARLPRVAGHVLCLGCITAGYFWVYEPETGAWSWLVEQIERGVEPATGGP